MEAGLRIFISEFVCGGGWRENTVAGSLEVEGRALLSAVVDDFSRIVGVEVDTTWDSRLGTPPFRGARTLCVDSPEQELRTFRRLAAHCDATLVIAPEFQGILSKRCRIVEDVGGRLLGPSSRAVALCSDKLRLAGHLRDAGVETISTRLVDWDGLQSLLPDGARPRFPIVVKPRDGAGSQNTFLVRDADDLTRLGGELATGANVARSTPRALRKDSGRATRAGDAGRCPPMTDGFIEQPYIAGSAVSVALVIAPSRRKLEVFVPARQCLSDDGRFRYLGGQIPLDMVDHDAIQCAAVSACRSVPGLRGYVGVDLVVPDGAPSRPVVVEINPRLTTSYLGYRRLTESNLAEWMLTPDRNAQPICWNPGPIVFDATGARTASHVDEPAGLRRPLAKE